MLKLTTNFHEEINRYSFLMRFFKEKPNLTSHLGRKIMKIERDSNESSFTKIAKNRIMVA